MKTFQKIGILTMAALLSLGFTACGKNGDGSSISGGNPSSVNETPWVKFEAETLTMDEWETKKISVKVSGAASVKYEVSDPSVIYLKGMKATALKVGTATITATSSAGATATLKITVTENTENRPALTITGEDDVIIGETGSYKATLSNATSYSVEYDTSDHEKATIDANGVLTAIAEGEVKITATARYLGVDFKNERTVQLKTEQIQKGEGIYQGMEKLEAKDGVYRVNKDLPADAHGLRPLTFGEKDKKETDIYLRFKVNFSAFNDTSVGWIAPSYEASGYFHTFGYTYGEDIGVFWYNGYSGGGFGGGVHIPSGQMIHMYFNIYTADGTKVMDGMEVSAWSPYYTVQANTDYIFEFKYAEMPNLAIAGFDDAAISEIVWSEKMLSEINAG